MTSGTLTTKSALILTGHGWGHGLGLGQWGAYGYAKHGWTYDRILTHYYVGTSLGAAPVSTIRVLVAQKAATTLSSTAAWTATDSAGTVVQLAAGAPLALKPDFAVEGQTLVPPVTFRSTAPLTVDGKAYRGKLVVSLAAKQLLVVNKLGLEAYVKGVVPMEMPSNWAPEAVKAQAVAARSYALAKVAKGRALDVYGEGRSQGDGGVGAGSFGRSAAVERDAWRVVPTPARSPNDVLLELRRPHGVGAGDDGRQHPVSRLGRRPVRHDLAEPQLGARGLRPGEGRQGAQLAVADRRPAGGSGYVAARADGQRAARRRDDGNGARQHAALGARPALDVVHTAAASSCRRRRRSHMAVPER